MVTQQPPDRDAAVLRAAEAVESVDKKLGPVFGELKRLTRFGWINRILIGVVAALVVAVAIIAVIAALASSKASQNRASNIAACRASNVTRTQQAGLWIYLINLSKPPATATPAQKAADEKLLADIRAHVATTFKPRDCVKTYG